MGIADSSEMNSADVLQQIREQTSDLATGEVQEEETTTEFQADEGVQGEEEQPEETTEQVETTQEAEPQVQPETDRRIKVDGREIEIPPEKVKEYLQKGFKFEEKMRELKEKEKSLEATQPPDFTKLNEDFVKQLQENPVATLLQFTKMVNETSEQERVRQRKMDKALEREMASSIPHWNEISDSYHDRRDEGHDHQTAVALAERDLFINLYLESKQKGVQEGEKKAILKQKANIPGGNKRGDSGTPDVKDMRNMTSSEMAKALGMKFTKHPDW